MCVLSGKYLVDSLDVVGFSLDLALDEGVEVQEVDLRTNLFTGGAKLGTVNLLNHTDVVVLELLGHLLEHLDSSG